jgi:hypothetical protein
MMIPFYTGDLSAREAFDLVAPCLGLSEVAAPPTDWPDRLAHWLLLPASAFQQPYPQTEPLNLSDARTQAEQA